MKSNDFLVLNSLSFIERTREFIGYYETVELYLDNDIAGKQAANWFMKNHKNCIDRSYIYKDYKDINEIWIGRK
jgi:hypothetical protein